MNRLRCLLSLLLCLCVVRCAALVFFGAGTAAGVAGYKYHKGALTVLYQAPYTKAWDAALKALESLNLKIEKQEHDMTAGRIYAKRADSTPVTVSLAYKSAEETEIVIRVGVLGDRDASIAIKEEIRKNLFKE
jgi:hypothetical protein